MSSPRVLFLGGTGISSSGCAPVVVALTPDHVRADVELFTGRTGRFVYISSASAYQTAPSRLPITESTPLRNPHW